MNCIIGPNGSGKSNLGDAVCFILGRLSSKDLRADNYSELVFKKKGGKSTGESEVYLQLDNKSGAFAIDAKTIEIKRKIKKSGQTQYKLNGKNVTRQQVLELLAPLRIHPDGHNIILQGDIARFVDMRPVEKRQVIEEVSGIGVYEERKQKTLRELEKVDEKLKEANIIVTEKETILRNLEKEKAEAEKYKSAKDFLEAAKASEVHLRLSHVEKRKESNVANLEKNAKDIERFQAQIDKVNARLDALRKESDETEEIIRKRGGEEDLALRKSIEDLRVSIEKSKTLVETSQNEITKSENRKIDLKKNLESLDEKISAKKNEIIELERELKTLEKDSKTKTDSNFQEIEQKLEKIEQQVEELQNKKSEINSKLQAAQTEFRLAEHELQSLNERLNEFESGSAVIDLPSAKAQYKKLVGEINKLGSEDSKIALKLGELRKILIKKGEELAKARVHASSAQEILMRDSAIKAIVGKKISGVFGTVADLGKADNKFSTALNVAAGGRMKNIVVEKPDIAIKCLNILKQSRAGIATFLPLSKLRTPMQKDVPKKKGVYGLAADLISTDKKFNQLFKYVFGNTIVVEDVNTAKSVGVGKYRLVTLEGDLFELSGAITGGYRRKHIGVGFEDKDSGAKINELGSAIEVAKKEIRQLEEQRGKLDVNLITLRKQKIELESKIELNQKIGGKERRKELENRIKELILSKKKFENQVSSFDREIKKLNEKLSKNISERDSLRAKIKELGASLQSGEGKETEIKRNLAVFKSELENSLLPEKESTISVIKSLEKETSQFNKQIKDEENKLKKLEKELSVKEKEVEKSQHKLRDLYAKKGKLTEDARNEEDKLVNAKSELNRVEQERNSLTVLRSELEGQIAGLNEELKQYEGIEPLETLRTVEEAKKKIRSLEHRLASMGNVNQKALEAYDVVKKEYENLAWKLSKLETEKSDILEIIEEIEKKKKDAFMKTYDEIAANFNTIFSKIADKHIAELYLENKENPFEGGVTVAVTDSKAKRIALASLSGGEKVLVALAFIFAIQEHEPAPFYLFDEIDAALDKVNSEKVANLLNEYGKKAQIIIISHNDAVISEADALYGVSMNKDTGESNVVSLKI